MEEENEHVVWIKDYSKVKNSVDPIDYFLIPIKVTCKRLGWQWEVVHRSKDFCQVNAWPSTGAYFAWVKIFIDTKVIDLDNAIRISHDPISSETVNFVRALSMETLHAIVIIKAKKLWEAPPLYKMLKQTVGSGDKVKPKGKQRKTTGAKRAQEWRRVEPLFRRGDDIQTIASALDIHRDTVTAIIEWAKDNGKT